MAQLQSFLQSIDDLRNIEWSKSWYWDVKFSQGNGPYSPAPPSPFDNWIPCVDYNEQRITANTLVLPFYISQYKFSHTKQNIDIQMTIHDDIYGTMYYWLLRWHNKVFDSSDGVCLLEHAYRQLDVIRLDGNKNILQQFCYYVIPEGQIVETFNSSSDTKTYSISFAVIGETPVPSQVNNNNLAADTGNTTSTTANNNSGTPADTGGPANSSQLSQFNNTPGANNYSGTTGNTARQNGR